MIESLYFIRPFWLLGIIPILLIWWFFVYKTPRSSNWQLVIDQHLLPRLGHPLTHKFRLNFLLPSLLVLTILALSGVSFFKQETLVYQQQETTLIMLDSSPSMRAKDVVPSRLKRAILLIKQFLAQDKNRTLLIAFSAEPYLISPPSVDDKPLLNLLQGFNVDTLPSAGSRLDLALQYADDLLTKKNTKANILLLTDAQDVTNGAFQAAKKLGQKISVIAISKDSAVQFKYAGKTQATQTNKRLLKLLAQSTGGLYQDLSVGNIDNFLRFNAFDLFANQAKKSTKKVDIFIDSGIYFVLLVLPLFLLFFAWRLKQ